MKVVDVIEQDDGFAILSLEDISEQEFMTFIKLGHKINLNEFDENECFRLGIIKCIEDSIEHEKNISEKCKNQNK